MAKLKTPKIKLDCEIRRAVLKLLKKIEEAHKNAANSKLQFGVATHCLD